MAFYCVVPGRKVPTHGGGNPPFTDRPVIPATPEKVPRNKVYGRSLSSSFKDTARAPTHEKQKFSTCGSSSSDKLADHIKALDGRRAKVLPNEWKSVEEGEKITARENCKHNSLDSVTNLQLINVEEKGTITF